MSAASTPIETKASSPEQAAREFTILMPCLNEAETLVSCIRKARASIDRLKLDGEVVIADNGSTDGSQQMAVDAGARVVNVPVRGYGAALYYGTLGAAGRYVIMGDSDDSYDFSRLDAFVEELRKGNDIVMGNRFKGGIRPGAMPWKNRHIGNPVLSTIGKVLFRCPVGDFHCGLRGYSRSAFERLSLQTTGMEFASEMVIKATLMRMRIAEVPTTLDKDGRSRPPHLRPWRDGWRHLRFMLLYSPRWLFLYPGIALTVIGLIVGAVVLPGPLAITRHVALDVHTLLVAFAAVILGSQAVAFSFCAGAYALNEGLLPEDPFMMRAFDRFRLEHGLVLGAVLFLFGIGGIGGTLLAWYRAGFGHLDVQTTLRIAIPGVAAMVLGVQIVLTSFLLSFLGLRKRR